MIDKNFEIAENPEILIDKDFDFKLVQLEGVKLGDDYKKINLLDIDQILLLNYEPYTNSAEKIEQFRNHDGGIHMAGKGTFIIKNQRITDIVLRGKYIDNLKQYNEQKIVDVYGEPNKVWNDDLEDEKILGYSNKRLYFLSTETPKESMKS
jgi:hypothetical protein